EIDGAVVGGDGNGLARAADDGGGIVIRVGVDGGGRDRGRVVEDGAAGQAAGDRNGDGEDVLMAVGDRDGGAGKDAVGQREAEAVGIGHGREGSVGGAGRQQILQDDVVSVIRA